MEYFNEKDVEIIMATGKSESEAKRELNRGSYVMELQDFIADYREILEAEWLNREIDEDEYEKEADERTISAITETAASIKYCSDGCYEAADEFNTVVNFNGEQYVIHWAL